jgi:hypothetical protein
MPRIPPDQVSPPARRLIGSRGVTARYGNVSLRTLDRWRAKGIVPQPDRVICGRNYWYEDALEQADRQRTIDAGAKVSISTHPPVA